MKETMTCPLCGLENPPSAEHCDCGRRLVAGEASRANPNKLFTAGHLLQAWGIGAALVLTEGAFSWYLPVPALW